MGPPRTTRPGLYATHRLTTRPESYASHRLPRFQLSSLRWAAGQDRAFRLFSTIQDQQSRELSQKHAARRAKRMKLREEELKLPRVLDLAACQVCRPQTLRREGLRSSCRACWT